MDTILIKAAQLMLSLSLLVIVHEGGHFLFAKLFKTRVEKFCLFFNPWFTLFRFKPKNSETEYDIGWLPLGGYVKISGMIDESMDTEQMKKPPQPWEFRSKPAWQRLLIMIGGVLFNFLLALLIYSMILFTWGDSYIPVQKAPLGMAFNETAHNVGFKDGDVLLSADGKPLERMGSDLLMAVADADEVTVLRNGKETVISIPDDMMSHLLQDSVTLAGFRMPFVADSIMSGSPAAAAGLQRGDSIIAMDGKGNLAFGDFIAELDRRRAEHSANRDVLLTYVRNGVTDTLTVTADEEYKIGVYAKTAVLPIARKSYGFFESFPAGIRLGVNTLTGYVNQFKYVFSKEGVQQLGGFGTIASIFPAAWDWHQFWYMTAFLSIILAFMNILPIPALDGGHVLFLLYEIVVRRKPSDKFMEYAQMAGMGILLLLLVWANLNDILRLL